MIEKVPKKTCLRTFITGITCLISNVYALAQYSSCAVNTGSGGVVPGDGTPHCFSLPVSGFPVPLPVYGTSGQCCLEGIGVSISSLCSGDLTISATSPAGTTLLLASQRGGSGINAYGSLGSGGCVGGGTTFRSYGSGSLTGSPPFITCAPGQGPYFSPDDLSPAGTNIFAGENINGLWSICVTVNNPSSCGGINNSVIVSMTGIFGNTASMIVVDSVSVQAGSSLICNGSSTILTATSTSTGMVSYTWSPVSGLSSSTGPQVLCCPSVSTVYTVTATDAAGYSATSSILISVADLPQVSTTEIQATCNNNDGIITAIPSGNSGYYSYVWNSIPPQFVQTATGLSPGSYSCIVTDSNGCSSAAMATILQPSPINVLTSSTNTYCNNANGMCNVSASGGAGSYSYLWNTVPVQTGATATGLTAGSYACLITDGAGCSATANVTVYYFSSGTITISAVSQPLCFGYSNGTATATITGGTSPYSYLWNTAQPQTTQTAINLPAGNYVVTVTDAAGCSSTALAIVSQPGQLNSLPVTISSDCNANNGQAGVIITGGVSPYNYSWNTSPPQYGATATGLPAGTYSCMISDANNCILHENFQVNNSQIDTVSIYEKNHLSCFGDSSGSVGVNLSGGTAPFSYVWNTTPAQTDSIASNLGAGSYMVTVTDDKGCTVTASYTISQPAQLTAISNFTNNYCGSVTALAIVNASGGTIPYRYFWSTVPAQTTHLVTGLSAGSYSCMVTDASGCTLENFFIIADLSMGTATISIDQQVGCNGEQQGAISAIVNGGSPPFSYLWNTQPVKTTASIDHLPAGNYQVLITDANGCNLSAQTTLSAPSPIEVNSSSLPVNCSNSDGSVTLVVNGGTPPYVYLWNTSPVQTSATVTGLDIGNYYCLITDAGNCSFTGTFKVSGSIKPTAGFSFTPDVVSMQNPQCSFINESQNATQWFWEFNDPGNPGFSNLKNPLHTFSDTGNYCVRLIASNTAGCKDTLIRCLEVTLAFSVYVPTAFTPNNDGLNDYFIPEMFGINHRKYLFEVYNRWGLLIFRTTDIYIAWNGAARNAVSKAENDIYIWRLKVQDEGKGEFHQFKGQVILVR